ncbi:MAG: MgtC/SapB family protein [Marivibrio sp.]|uniref:MgtC/SapB family protein n=1 Tax=Marivibrio sp. TaxID=2039719 RepID=UPI0032EF71BD
MDGGPIEPGAIIPLAVALALGLLIGLERGWSRRGLEEGARVAGVRTYGLIGLLGGFAGLVSEKPALVFAAVGFLALTAVLSVAYWQSIRRTDDVGVTSLAAALLTFVFGAAATLGYMTEASAAAVTTAFLLGSKTQIHGWVKALEETELRAGLKLLLISVVILPVLPDQGYGPWRALNPYQIWWMVVLIAAVSFAGYFAMRLAGPGKGAALTGLFAGLASSTALTLHFSRLARSDGARAKLYAAGVLIACGTMFPRMAAVTFVLNRDLLLTLWPAAAAMAAMVYGGALLLFLNIRRTQQETGEAAPLSNPLQLKAAIGFGAVLAVVMLAAEGLERAFGGAGVAALAAVSGVTDVDAITLTLASRAQDDLALALSAFGIILAGSVNSLVKAGMALAVGGARFGLLAAGPLALAALVGLGVVWTLTGGAGF